MNLAIQLNDWWISQLAACEVKTTTKNDIPRGVQILRERGWTYPKVRFPGITEDAAALGVTRPHLWMVLTEARVSKRLTTRYRELKAQQRGGTK